jgi:ATP-dependent protease ClpP protease subunit
MGRIVSAIKATKAKVITYAQGCVASAANTVWISGHERHILPGAYFMQHMSSQGLGGKSSDIAAKSSFCVEYISKQLQPALEIGLFTDTEVKDMVEKSSDIYISGREASVRIAERQASVAY